MKWKEHVLFEKIILGKKHPEVHFFLDFLPEHRKITHNFFGLLLVKKLFGNEALKSAILHILLDYYGSYIRSNKKNKSARNFIV